MKTTNLLRNMLLTVLTGCVNLALGQTLSMGQMTVTKVESATPQAVRIQTDPHKEILVAAPGTNVLVPCKIGATNYLFKGPHGGRTNWTMRLIEFHVSSTSEPRLSWYCWASALTYPHDFTVFTAGGKSYACYASNEGVRLFHVDGTNDSDSARRRFLERNTGPEAIEPLTTKVLKDSVGAAAFYGFNALYWAINVDEVAEVDGELCVTIHGGKPKPQFSFALKDGRWVLLPLVSQ